MVRSLMATSLIHEGRYKIYRQLGTGTFGEVYEAAVMPDEDQFVAIKVATAQRYNGEAMRELGILQRLQAQDTERVLRVFDSFEIQVGSELRFCIVIEKFDQSLAQILTKKRDGFSLGEVAVLGRQLLFELTFFQSMTLLHLDLKPANILVNSAKKRIKITDFGSACFGAMESSKVAQTPAYRAPEVSLELHPYSTAADMWSLGVILAELYIPRFRPVGDVRRLPSLVRPTQHLLIRNFGMPPPHMLTKLSQIQVNELRVLSENTEQMRVCLRLNETSHSKAGMDSGLFPAFVDLMKRMFAFEPRERLTPQQALSHEFFKLTEGLTPEDVHFESSSSTPWPTQTLATSKLQGSTRKKPRRSSVLVRDTKRTPETTPPHSSSGGSGGRETGSSAQSQDSDEKLRLRYRSAH